MATKQDKLAGNNLIIVLVLVTLLVVGITALVSKSLGGSIARDTKVVSAKAKAEKQLKENLVNAPKLVDAYQAMGAQGVVLSDALPTTSDLPSLLVAYENIASQSGLTLKSIGVDTVTASTLPASAEAGSFVPTPKPYNFIFAFDGSYAGLGKLLAAMELNARPTRVTNVTLQGTGSELSGNVSVETYLQDKAELPIGTETIK